MLKLHLASVVLLICPVLCVAQGQRRDNAAIPHHKQVAQAALKADKTTLYEGLPHPSFEGDLLKQELQTKKTFDICKYPFYQEVLPLKQKDAVAFTKLFSNSKSFQPIPQNVRKMCGGFHPDYCIEWQVDKMEYQCLVCFGCHEVKVYGPKGLLFHAEMTEAASDEFEKILKPYHRNRPLRATP